MKKFCTDWNNKRTFTIANKKVFILNYCRCVFNFLGWHKSNDSCGLKDLEYMIPLLLDSYLKSLYSYTEVPKTDNKKKEVICTFYSLK